MKIYIVEDEKEICDNLVLLLEQYGYEALGCENFKEVIEDIEKHAPDLILLDVMLPFKDGYTICRDLREKMDTPVIMLTGQSSEMEEVMSLQSGADDFVAKPYHPQVLIAHIEVVLKRTAGNVAKNTITVSNVTLDRLAGTLSYNGRQIELGRNERRILNLLMGESGRIVSREEIMEELWQDGQFVDENTLNVNILRLRRKLGELGCEDLLKTKRGMGYII